MAFPSINATATSNHTTDLTTHASTIATGSVGDLLMIFWATDGSGDVVMGVTDSEDGNTWTKGWADELESSGHNAGLRWRISNGTETGTATFTSTGSEAFASISLRVAAAEIATPFLDATRAESASAETTPNPPSHTPSGGAKDYLWIAFASWDVNRTVSTYPTGYTGNNLTSVANVSTGCGVALGTKTANATVDDPGTFTISSAEDWSAATVAIHPAAGAGSPTVSLVTARQAA